MPIDSDGKLVLPDLTKIEPLGPQHAGMYFSAIPDIRYQQRDRFNPGLYLQQLYVDVATGAQVWKDVPTVDEDGNPIVR